MCGGWNTNLSAGFISYPAQPTGVFVGQTYYNSTSNIAYVYNGTTWVMLSGTIGGLVYQGTWNATTNTPTLGNGGAGGSQGDYYVVSVAGTTSIDGISDWQVGDWIVNNGTVWEKVDNSEAGLPTTLAVDNTTGAFDISYNSGQGSKYNEGSGGRLVSLTTTALRTWSLPNATGTIALTSDITSTIYNGNGTIGTGRVATLTDTLNFVGFASTTGIGIGTVSFAPTGIFEVRANDSDGSRMVGNSTLTGVAFTVRNSSSSLAIFNNVGTVQLVPVASYTLTVGTGAVGTAKLTINGIGATLATVNQAWRDSALTVMASVRDDGRWGFNTAPETANRIAIDGGTGLTGVINIYSSNLADNGYAILAQGGTSVANYNGIWSEVSIAGTGTNIALKGGSSIGGGSNNYGLQGSARNGTSQSIGVYGTASGGDSVNSTDSAGVLGVNSSNIATSKKAVWGYTINDVAGGTDFGVKGEAANNGTTAINYGGHFRASGAGAGRINIGVFAQANGGSSATNYALITDGGNIGFGTTTPSAQALVEMVSTTQAFLVMRMTAAQASAITPSNGMILYVTDTNGTFLTAGFYKYQEGFWLPF